MAEPPAKRSFTGAFEEQARKNGARRLYSWMRGDCSEEASLSFAELREQTCNLCVALRQKWGANTGDRVMLVYPPGLDFLVAFFGAQYAAVIAVPYYPPIMPTSPMPSAGAKKLLADGLEKLSRISQSCSPILFLSTKFYLRAQWLCSMAIRDEECKWNSDWKWRAPHPLFAPASPASPPPPAVANPLAPLSPTPRPPAPHPSHPAPPLRRPWHSGTLRTTCRAAALRARRSGSTVGSRRGATTVRRTRLRSCSTRRARPATRRA